MRYLFRLSFFLAQVAPLPAQHFAVLFYRTCGVGAGPASLSFRHVSFRMVALSHVGTLFEKHIDVLLRSYRRYLVALNCSRIPGHLHVFITSHTPCTNIIDRLFPHFLGVIC